MPFFQIISQGESKYAYGNTLRRVLIHLSHLGSPYQSYDSIEKTTDSKLEYTYKHGYVPFKGDEACAIYVREVTGVPVYNVENGLKETTKLAIPRLPLKSTTWKHFLVKDT